DQIKERQSVKHCNPSGGEIFQLAGACLSAWRTDKSVSGNYHADQKSYHSDYSLFETDLCHISFVGIEIEDGSRDMNEGQSKKIRQWQTRAAPAPLTNNQADAYGEPDREQNQHGRKPLIRAGETGGRKTVLLSRPLQMASAAHEGVSTGENRLWPVEMIIQRQQPMHETHHESTKSHNPNQARTLDKIGYHQTADETVRL